MIDVHILTLPGDNRLWLDDLLADLDGEPDVNVTVADGIPGNTATAHRRAYENATAEFVSYVDSDDRYVKGAFAQLLEPMLNDDRVAFTYTGEQQVDEDLNPTGRRSLPPPTYDYRLHASDTLYMHGIYLFRRDVLLRALKAGGIWPTSKYSAWHATLAMSVQCRKEGLSAPVPVRTIGRLWRIRAGASHQQEEARHAKYFQFIRKKYAEAQ